MKKLMIALAFVGFATAGMAQDYSVVPSKKFSVATNSFWANWFVSVGGQANAVYSSQEVHDLGFNPFNATRGEFGFNVAVGKWFTPGIGLRTQFEGIWSKQVNNENDHHSYHYFNAHEDVMFNLSNLFFGYNAKRFWNFIPYVGLGVGRNMTANTYDLTYNAGLLNNFRLSNRLQLFVDLKANAVEGSFDAAVEDPWRGAAKYHARHWDKQLGVALGLTYNLGKNTWEKVPDVDALIAMNKEQLDALNASLKEQQDENARLRDLLANQKPATAGETIIKTETKTQLVATAQSVFFNIGSSKIASRKDLVNVKELAEYAKENGSKIVVTGYADSKTGSKAFNQALSLKRANAVKDELVKMGVSADQIEVAAAGGVNTLSPFSYNRRATVKLQ